MHQKDWKAHAANTQICDQLLAKNADLYRALYDADRMMLLRSYIINPGMLAGAPFEVMDCLMQFAGLGMTMAGTEAARQYEGEKLNWEEVDVGDE